MVEVVALSQEASVSLSNSLRRKSFSERRDYDERTKLLQEKGSEISEDRGEDSSATGATYRIVKPLVYGIVATSAMGSFLWGYNLSVMAGALLLINYHFHTSALWQGIIVSVMLGGAVLGAATAGMLNDKLGRWKVMMLSAILFVASAIVMAVSPSVKCLVVGRAVGGIGVGLFTVTGSIYVAELAPDHLRGKLVFFSYVLTGGGVLASAVVAGVFSIDPDFAHKYGWRCILGFAIIPAAIMFIGLWFTPETPRWLVFHNKVDKARKVLLQRVRHSCEVEDELAKIIEARDSSTQGNSLNIFQFVKRIVKDKAVLYALFVGCSLHILRSLGGAVIVLNYSATIFNKAGFSEKKSIWLAIVPAFANFAAKFVGSLLLGRMGRRNLYFVSSLGATLFLLLLGASFYINNRDSPAAVPMSSSGPCDDYHNCGNCVTNSRCGFCAAINGTAISNGTCSEGNARHDKYSNQSCVLSGSGTDFTHPGIKTRWYFDHCPDNNFASLAIVSTCMYVVFFAVGLAPLPWVINAEIYPTWARGNAVSIGSVFSWLCSLLVSLTFPILVDVTGQPLIFGIYAIVSFIGFLFMLFLVPDTKEIDLENTEKFFQRLYFLTWCKTNKNI